MARPKKIVEINYDETIAKAQEELELLSQKANVIKLQIKDKKAEIKKLERDKVAYEEWKEKRDKEFRTQEIAKLISESEYTLDEIKELLVGETSGKEDNTTISK
nr:MAG TPA: hypothetical protein [Caudoviricetes sp.]